MNETNLKVLPSPPSLVKTIVAGFDNITNNIGLILFPIGLDLLIWFAPRLRLVNLINNLVGSMVNQTMEVAPDMETEEIIRTAEELWILAGERINILISLRSYPVGIPSLMSSILPLNNPLGTPQFIDVNSVINVFFLAIILSLVGLVIGTLFFNSVCQAAVKNAVNWRQMVKDWPRLSIQVILLSLTWLLIIVGLSIPASCVASLAALGSLALGQCVFLIFGGFLIWIIFPLLFSPHGIFISGRNAWASIKQGFLITRLTLPTTSLFFLAILLLIQGLGFLWRVPPEDSWLMLLSTAGHAFITTSVLSASFIYYRDAEIWVQSIQKKESEIPEEPIK